MRSENQTKPRVWEGSSLCPETSINMLLKNSISREFVVLAYCHPDNRRVGGMGKLSSLLIWECRIAILMLYFNLSKICALSCLRGLERLERWEWMDSWRTLSTVCSASLSRLSAPPSLPQKSHITILPTTDQIQQTSSLEYLGAAGWAAGSAYTWLGC